MRKIKLEKNIAFSGRCELNIIDVTEGAPKKRGTITVEYSPEDIAGIKKDHPDLESAMDLYRDRIYGLVKYYISGDWECTGGYDEALKMISEKVKPCYE